MLIGKRLREKSILQAKRIKAISHPHRISILHLLSNADMRVQELSVHMEISPSLLEHHLSKLIALGLIKKQLVGAMPFYGINVKGMEELKKMLSDL